tara:strand:+ start:99 stop:572 length:474 start_codon:yes stop_codon:yes gene_type:complete
MIIEFVNVYNNLINLSRNKKIFAIFTVKDTFSDRLIIFMFHFALLLREYKEKNNKKYLQDLFDYIFRQIELSLREIGYGDVSINKKMKNYINIFFSIIDKFNNWNSLNNKEKSNILGFFIKLDDKGDKLVNYFNNFQEYLSKNSLNSFTKSVINHKF